MFCRECGNELDDDVSFCLKCGTPIEQKDSNRVIKKDEPIVTDVVSSNKSLKKSEDYKYKKRYMNSNLRYTLGIFLRGILMGISDSMPGVSGGTIALLTGIYEKFIGSISNIKLLFFIPLFKGDLREFKKQLFDEVDFEFFIPLLLGMGIAVLLMSGIISFLLKGYSAFIYSLFVGLIIASTILLYRQLDAFNVKALGVTVIFALISYTFVGLNSMEVSHTLPILFISGFTAVVIPGISGSSVLLLLGQYEYVISAIHTLKLIDVGSFLIGAIIGYMAMSRVIKYFLRNYKTVTIAAIIGLIIGSLRKLIQHIVTVPDVSLPICLIMGLIGMTIVLTIGLKSDYKLI